MRARSRRSASDYFSAVLLELFIMGVFVLIAQPQLRDGLLELVQPSPDASSRPATAVDAGTPKQATAGYAGEAAPYTAPPAAELPWASSGGLRAISLASAGRPWPDDGPRTAPLEHFESFAVSVPETRTAAAAAQVTGPVPVVGPAQVIGAQQRVAGYAPAAAASAEPTRLSAGDWNIASAAQSRRPLGGWTSAKSADSAYRDAYPPPFGTQSQWK